jgi:hypothetical protein
MGISLLGCRQSVGGYAAILKFGYLYRFLRCFEKIDPIEPYEGNPNP